MNTREASRQNWGVGSTPGYEALQTGALQRIADATETMARRYAELIDERDYWKRRYEEVAAQSRRNLRSAIALRGVVTKLKAKREGSA